MKYFKTFEEFTNESKDTSEFLDMIDITFQDQWDWDENQTKKLISAIESKDFMQDLQNDEFDLSDSKIAKELSKQTDWSIKDINEEIKEIWNTYQEEC